MRADPVVPAAQDQVEPVITELVLPINTGFLQLLLIVAGRFRESPGHRLVNRIIDVERAVAEEERPAVEAIIGIVVDTAEIEADDRVMADLAGGRGDVEAVVGREALDLFAKGIVRLADSPVVTRRGRVSRIEEACRVIFADRRIFVVIAVFGVGNEFHRAGQGLIQFITDAVLRALEQIGGIVEIGRTRDRPVRIGSERSRSRDEAARAAAIMVVLVITEQGQPRVGAKLEGKGGRHGDTLVAGMILIGRGGAVDRGDPRIEEGRQRSGNGAGRLPEIVGTTLQRQFGARGGGWAAQFLVQDAARRCRTVKHRGRTLEDVDRLEQVKIDAGRIEGRGVRHCQPVDILPGREATHRYEIVAWIVAVILAADAGSVAHRLLQVDEAQQVDLVAGDDRHRLRRFDQGNAALVRGDCAVGDIMPRGDDDLARVVARGLERGGIAGAVIGCGCGCG